MSQDARANLEKPISPRTQINMLAREQTMLLGVPSNYGRTFQITQAQINNVN